MKNQVLFSLKDKSKKSKCRLLQFLVGALRVDTGQYTEHGSLGNEIDRFLLNEVSF